MNRNEQQKKIRTRKNFIWALFAQCSLVIVYFVGCFTLEKLLQRTVKYDQTIVMRFSFLFYISGVGL